MNHLRTDFHIASPPAAMASSPSLEAPGRLGPEAQDGLRPGVQGRPNPGGQGLLARILAFALVALAPWPLAVRAQPSRTAESIWSQEDASQRALQLVPSGARVDSTACQEIGVGSMGGLPRYRCTVRFSPGAASPGAASPGGASPASASP
jgi:hypothetical protein